VKNAKTKKIYALGKPKVDGELAYFELNNISSRELPRVSLGSPNGDITTHGIRINYYDIEKEEWWETIGEIQGFRENGDAMYRASTISGTCGNPVMYGNFALGIHEEAQYDESLPRESQISIGRAIGSTRMAALAGIGRLATVNLN
jgi:hypothetical protein